MVCWYSFQKVSVESCFADKNAVQGETMDTAKTIKNLRRRTMAKAFLISGKICCGKSTYAERLRIENNAVLLSVDEIMLAVFGPYTGDKHDEYTEKIQKYLFEKSVEIINSGINVILDWGFWSKCKRTEAREFYTVRDIECEFYYIDISDKVWKERIEHRNELVLKGENAAYIIDSNLAAKFEGLFEPPSEDEIDVWVHC